MDSERSLTATGSCLCGAVQFSIDGILFGINYCHCQHCRKASGTAFATSAAVQRDALRFRKPNRRTLKFYTRLSETRYFCGQCGSPIYSKHDDSPDRIYIRLGTLNNDASSDGNNGLQADVHIHVASKASWYTIRDSVPQRQHDEDLWF